MTLTQRPSTTRCPRLAALIVCRSRLDRGAMDNLERAKGMDLFSRIALAVSVPLLVAIAAGAVWLVAPLVQLALAPEPPESVFATVPSPDGALRLVGIEYDHGGLGGEVVIRVRGRVPVALDRRLAADAWNSRPGMSWVDSRTVDISGHRLDVYQSEWIDLRE